MRAVAIFEAVRREGGNELHRPLEALAMSGFVAGLALGFSILVRATIETHLPPEPWRPLISCLGYTFGFLLVVLGQLQLFTENTIKAVCPVLDEPSPPVWLKLLRLWSVVLITNIAGAMTFGGILWLTRDLQPEVWKQSLEISRHALNFGFLETLLRGVGAGWLMAALVWMRPTSGTSQPLLVILVTYVISIADFTHVVAGSTEAAVLVFGGERSFFTAGIKYLIPAALGNFLGGTCAFTLLVWIQIRNELLRSKAQER